MRRSSSSRAAPRLGRRGRCSASARSQDLGGERGELRVTVTFKLVRDEALKVTAFYHQEEDARDHAEGRAPQA